MKTILSILLVSTTLGYASPESWTDKNGRSAQMELIEVSSEGDEKVGEFRTGNGKTVKLKASELSEESAKRLAEWKPTSSAVSPSSVFDKALEGNLVRLNGKSLKRTEADKPAKYYLFYYTASWCPPCRKFTPELVKFYDGLKPDNKDFELILVTSDREEDAMEEYAVSAKMNWPQIRFSKAAKFRKEFPHPGTGIPNLVLTDLEGNIIKSSYVDGKYVGPTSVMNHLGQLLKQ